MLDANVLGVDPGSYVTGWAVIERDGSCRYAGVLRADPKADFEIRRCQLRRHFWFLFDMVRYRWDLHPQVVALEDPMSNRAGTVKVLSTVRAMFEEMAHERGLPYLNVRSSEWRGLVIEEAGRKCARGEVKQMGLGIMLQRHPELSVNRHYDDAGVPFAITEIDENTSEAYWIAEYVRRNAQSI